MTFIEIYGLAGVILLALVSFLWLASLLLRDSSIIDSFWGLGFIFCAWIYFALTPDGLAVRKWLVCILVTVWGLRLTLYITWRNWGKGEDYRYKSWRQSAANRWWWQSYIKVFLLQGLLIWVISIPLLAAQTQIAAGRLTWLDYAGCCLWLIGFLFEAMGDAQLARFRSNPAHAGQLLTSGLWRYTRHPNYFGDATLWWGYFLIAAATGGYWTFYSPLLMTFLLLKVSGVALLEKTLVETRPGYRQYVQTTNAFIPWFPRIKP
jgi:steroid 5-alpha reductase family enzyme